MAEKKNSFWKYFGISTALILVGLSYFLFRRKSSRTNEYDLKIKLAELKKEDIEKEIKELEEQSFPEEEIVKSTEKIEKLKHERDKEVEKIKEYKKSKEYLDNLLKGKK